jgi:hypothetical protein
VVEARIVVMGQRQAGQAAEPYVHCAAICWRRDQPGRCASYGEERRLQIVERQVKPCRGIRRSCDLRRYGACA